jgi:hypothetical protein
MPAQTVCVRRGLFVALGAAIAVTAGCQPSPPTPCFPVTGKVVFQKRPVTGGTVTFTPDSSKGNQSKETAYGRVTAEGTFSLVTGGRDGAPLGWYKVSVTATPPPPGESAAPEVKPAGKMPNIPAKFHKPDTSGISIEVKESAPPGTYDIELK